ncbi:MAG: hypothetical protein KDK24_03885 [Pseudooceanicola sp.]|nr:hypothetical protein [Pseudooceanicola sp.]
MRNEATNHPQRRYGGVVAVIFDLDYLHTTFEPSFDILRERHFERREDGRLPILHLRKMKNPDPRGPFSSLLDAEKRALWEKDCLGMYRRAKYSVVSVGIDKIAFYAQHGSWQGSIYETLVGNAIERFFYFLRGRGTGDVVAEATNSDLDGQLAAMYRKFWEEGTDHISADSLRPVLTSKEIKIKPKSKDIIGLQMADLLASTCFSHCKRIYAKGPAFDPFAMSVADLMEGEKFYRNPATNDPHGYGRVWRPA